MACGGLRAASLSTDTNLDVGWDPPNPYLHRQRLNIMLCDRVLFSCQVINFFYPLSF